jgi:beta-lactamase class A
MIQKILLVFTTFFYTQVFGQTELREKIEQIISTKKADIGISILNLENGDTLSINGNKHYPMISVFKFHIALTVLNKVDKDELSLKQNLFIKKSELLENTWSPFQKKYPEGNLYITLKEALEWMIIYSDNNLCDILIRLAGGVKMVEKFINNQDFIIQNNEEGMHQNWDAQFLNTTTPNFSNQLLNELLKNKLLTKKSTKFLFETMVSTSVGQNRIKGKLPIKTEVAHRTGSSYTNEAGMTGAINDIGIVKLPNGNHFAISIFVHNTTEKFEDGEKIIADITKETWEYYAKYSPHEAAKSTFKLDTLTLFDSNRQREIPIAIYKPNTNINGKQKVVIFSHGYGQNKGGDYVVYSYLTEFLASNGFFVVSIQHELATDSLLPLTGNPQILRRPFWDRGADNILFVINELKKTNPDLNYKHITLIGHSNGGDMTALFPAKYPNTVDKIITLDNRRMSFPKTKKVKVYSLRSSDQAADEGVLPTEKEIKKYKILIVKLTKTTHNEMDDNANDNQKKEIQNYILTFLNK